MRRIAKGIMVVITYIAAVTTILAICVIDTTGVIGNAAAVVAMAGMILMSACGYYAHILAEREKSERRWKNREKTNSNRGGTDNDHHNNNRFIG